MESLQEIKIGKGINNILFGVSRPTFKKVFGEPTEIDKYNANEDEDDEYLTEAWHYDNIEISASFDEEDDWKLTTLSTSSSNATLNGKNVIGMNLTEIQDLTSSLDLGEAEVEEIEENQVLLSFIASSINFWFENGELSEVQWGVLWENEDSPKWPI